MTPLQESLPYALQADNWDRGSLLGFRAFR